jgi:hypothetical protein
MHPDHEHEQFRAPAGRRVTIKETALILGTTIEGGRARITLGTLRKAKAPDGTVCIILDDDQTSPDGIRTPHDDRPYPEQTLEDPALVEAVREQVERLQAELDAWKSVVATRDRELEARGEELRRREHRLAAVIERIPAIEASESPKSPPIVQRRAGATEAAKQPWWRFWP